MQLTTEQRIKRAHVAMMKHPETAFYSGVMMMGETEVVDSERVTAYTDGVNKKYGRAFADKVCEKDSDLRGLILHENLHIAFRHLLHSRDLFTKNRALANKAADYVVNDVIMSIKDKAFITLPEGGLYDPKYHNMNMREVYRLLEEEQQEQQQQEKSNGSGQAEPQDGDGDGDGSGQYEFDEHDINSGPASAEEAQALEGQIDRAMREGALLAGRLGLKLPRQIMELLEPSVDWRKELAEFVSASCSGKDEYTWRRFNRRQLANDLYFPSVEAETIGEVVIAIDTSGSIGQEQINEFASELASICSVVTPESVRVLWWDTMVHAEQLFTPDKYDHIATLLKPEGGGGTEVSCVSRHINKHEIRAECVIVFTDGFVEDKVKWDINVPTLWLVTQHKSWVPPAGQKVFVEK